jgi:uncharacterized protein
MTDPFTTDPIFDPTFPPMTVDIHFKSHGALLNGVIHVAALSGPHPTVLILHGFPGNERNFDLAHLYRRAGFNTVVFHYRGSWGSEGDFSFAHCLEDVASALEYLLSPEVTERFRIDPSRLALVGHSMGGWVALMAAAKDKRIKATISICGANFGDFATQLLTSQEAIEAWSKGFDEDLAPLRGTTGASLIHEVLQHGEIWNLRGLTRDFSKRPVMLVAGQLDTLTITSITFVHQPLVAAFQEADVLLEEKTYDTTHTLPSHRVALARDTLHFLQHHL